MPQSTDEKMHPGLKYFVRNISKMTGKDSAVVYRVLLDVKDTVLSYINSYKSKECPYTVINKFKNYILTKDELDVVIGYGSSSEEDNINYENYGECVGKLISCILYMKYITYYLNKKNHEEFFLITICIVYALNDYISKHDTTFKELYDKDILHPDNFSNVINKYIIYFDESFLKTYDFKETISDEPPVFEKLLYTPGDILVSIFVHEKSNVTMFFKGYTKGLGNIINEKDSFNFKDFRYAKKAFIMAVFWPLVKNFKGDTQLHFDFLSKLIPKKILLTLEVTKYMRDKFNIKIKSRHGPKVQSESTAYNNVLSTEVYKKLTSLVNQNLIPLFRKINKGSRICQRYWMKKYWMKNLLRYNKRVELTNKMPLWAVSALVKSSNIKSKIDELNMLNEKISDHELLDEPFSYGQYYGTLAFIALSSKSYVNKIKEDSYFLAYFILGLLTNFTNKQDKSMMSSLLNRDKVTFDNLKNQIFDNISSILSAVRSILSKSFEDSDLSKHMKFCRGFEDSLNKSIDDPIDIVYGDSVTAKINLFLVACWPLVEQLENRVKLHDFINKYIPGTERVELKQVNNFCERIGLVLSNRGHPRNK